ncbi:MAG TPA: GIY-YIG nuclease family protein [Candidatus Angelobacter sp.]
MANRYFTYIMSNKSRRVYVGSTSELQVRVFKHKKGAATRPTAIGPSF